MTTTAASTAGQNTNAATDQPQLSRNNRIRGTRSKTTKINPDVHRW
jgi:hypothetical protein